MESSHEIDGFVTVSGFNSNTTEDDLVDLFASLCSKGSVESVAIDRKLSKARIKLSEVDDAKKVLEMVEVVYTGTTLTITPSIAPDLDETLGNDSFLKVSGFSGDTTEEDLEDLFTSLCSKGNVESVELNPKHSTATVKFSEVEDADAVLAMTDISYVNNKLNLSRVLDDSLEEDKNRSVLVNGVPEEFGKEKLELFFANPSRGGPVERIECGQQPEAYVVIFVDRSDAENVVNNKSFTRGKSTFIVDWYVGPQNEESTTVVITGLPSNTDDEFLEDILGSVQLLARNDRVTELQAKGEIFVVSFSNTAVVNRLLTKSKIQVGEMNLSFIPYTDDILPNKEVLISGLPEGFMVDHIKLFFTNRDKTGGGPVEKVVVDTSSHTATVLFVNGEDAARVVERESFTRKNGVVLHAKWLEQEDIPEEETDPRAIILSNFNQTIDEDAVETYLEKLTKESIESIELNRENNWAKVTFESETGAKKVVDAIHGNQLTIGSMQCSLRYCPGANQSTNDQQDLTTFYEVTGIPQNLSEDFIVLFFESNDKSGGGEIADYRYDSLSGRAYIRFKNACDGENVIAKASKVPLQLNKARLRVNTRIGNKMPHFHTSGIEVFDVPETYTKDDLHDVFTNERYGGGPVEDISMRHGRIVVTFVDATVAEAVIINTNRKPIKLEDTVITVTPLACPDVATVPLSEEEPLKILITNISEDTGKEEVQDFIERYGRCQVENVIYGLKVGKAMIELIEHPDGEDPWQEIRMRPLNGTMVSLQYVAKSKSIEVYDYGTMTIGKLRNYFESRRCIPSQYKKGGRVQHVEKIADYECVVVTFEKEEDAMRVLENTQHKTNDKVLTVQQHYESLGILPKSHNQFEPTRSIPRDIVIIIPDATIYKYLRTSKSKALCALMKSVTASIEWSTDQCEVIVKYITEGAHSPTATNAWESDVRKTFDEFTKLYKHNSVDIPLQTQVAMKRLGADLDEQNRKYKGKDVTMNFEDDRISITGKSELVASLTDHFKKTVGETMEYCQRLSERTRASTKLNAMQMEFLNWLGVFQEIQATFQDLKITRDKDKLILEGTASDIKEAKVHILEISHSIQYCEPSWYRDGMAKVMQNQRIRQHVMDECRRTGQEVYIFIDGTRKCCICSRDMIACENAMHDILNIFTTTKIATGEHIIPILFEPEFDSFIQRKEKEVNYEVAILKTEQSEISVTGIDRNVDKVVTQIMDYFDTHAQVEEFVDIHLGKNRLLNISPNVTQTIASERGMQIQFVHGSDVSGIVLKGPARSVEGAKKRLLDEINSITSSVYKVTAPGMSQYFVEQPGRDYLAQLESELTVGIMVLDDNGQYFHVAKVKSDARTSTDLNGIKITLEKGNIDELACDAYFVSIQEDFKHAEGPSTLLIKRGGKKVRSELDKLRQSSSHIFPGSAFITTAGDLTGRHIVHCVEPPWTGGNTGEDGVFYDALYQGLKDAQAKGCRTVNVPILISHAIPESLQITKVLDVLSDYADRYKLQTTIKEVRLVVSDECNIKTSKMLFKKRFVKTSKEKSSDTHAGGYASPITRPPETLDYTIDASTSSRLIPTIVKGELAKSKVDALVNTTSTNLVLSNGAVSTSILKEGGSSIQDQCAQYLTKLGKTDVDIGEVVPSGGGKLHCKRIYHGALSSYSPSDDTPTKILEKFVWQCLQNASDEKLQSLAFPSLGTGNLRFPTNLVASTMITKVIEFGNKYPNTSLQHVEIVLYPKDTNVIKAFERKLDEVNQSLTKPKALHTTATTPNVVRPKTKVSVKPKHTKKSKTKLAMQQISFKGITIDIVQGDITAPTTDAIVYSTDKDFNFGSQIGVNLKRQAGDKLVTECKTAKWNNGVAITGAGKLKCKYVIHIDAPTNSDEWSARIAKCLSLAESRKISSISFPALGTGIGNVNPGTIATKMVEGIEEFVSATGVKYLKTVKVVIYDDKMLGHFVTKFRVIASQPIKKQKGWFASAVDVITSFLGGDASVDKIESADESSESEEEFEHIECVENISLEIYTFKKTKSNIDQTKKRITEMCKQMSCTKRIDGTDDSEDIFKLSQEQIIKINGLQKQHHVTIDIQKGKSKFRNMIEIKGRRENVTEALVAIHRCFREADKEKERQMLQEKVKWQFQAKDQYHDYSTHINWDIEEAHKNNQPYMQLEDVNGKFEIDLYNMVEIRMDTTEGRKIRRYAPDSVTLPTTWASMSSGDRHKEVVLSQTDTDTRVDYELVFTQFKNSLEEADKCTTTLKQVVEIIRVQNPWQYKRYMMHKNHMPKHGEQQLWHGTSDDTISLINTNGFNRSYAGKNATVYGKGVYFSRYAGYSHRYAKPDSNGFCYMYLCRVLTGEYALGNKDLIDTPPKDPKNPSVMYDSVVDNMATPSMFVIFSDTQAYPEYLIKYQV